MSSSKIDLSGLTVRRDADASGSRRVLNLRRVLNSPLLLRYVLPVGILLSFLGLFVAAAGRQWLPAREVTVVPVLLQKGVAQREGTPLFQAAGWVEPSPTSVRVPALTGGVIQEVFVVEGQLVEQGQPVARLISLDAELALEQAKASLSVREGELQRAEAEYQAAKVRLQKPLHLQVEIAEARSQLARATLELHQLPFLITAAKAGVAFTDKSLQGKRAARAGVAGVIVEQAARDDAAARAKLNELEQRSPGLQQQVDALQDKVASLEEQLTLLTEETRQLQEADARRNSAAALRDGARVEVRQAELSLQRTTVCAPITGRILTLLAFPGSIVRGLEESGGGNSGIVLEMYKPERLQVRADVRLEDVSLVTPGAPVDVQTASSGHVLRGRVLRATSSANIQKNTLEVKVELIDPPSMVSPEMLVTATFLAPESPADEEASEELTLQIPAKLVQQADNGSYVWLVDADNRAVRRTITTTGLPHDGLQDVADGLRSTDKLISSQLHALQPGQRVVITGEDAVLGIEQQVRR